MEQITWRSPGSGKPTEKYPIAFLIKSSGFSAHEIYNHFIKPSGVPQDDFQAIALKYAKSPNGKKERIPVRLANKTGYNRAIIEKHPHSRGEDNG